VPLVAALVAALGYRMWASVLNSDLRFTLGALRLGRGAGFDATEVWMHRPLAYRVLMDPFSRIHTGHLGWDERLIVAALLASAVAACAVAGWGLTRRAPEAAWPFAAGCGVALCWSGTWFLGEPEWVATALALAGAGVALGTDVPGRRRWVGLLGAAALLSLAALQKYTSVSVAVCVLIVMATVSLRRAAATLLTCLPVGSLLFGATLLLGSHEWQWFREMGLLNVPQRGLPQLIGTFTSLLVGWPVVALVPVCLALAVGHRWRAALAAVGVLAVSLAFAYAQGTWFLYHWTAAVTLAAGWLAASLARTTSRPARLVAYGTIVVVTLTSAALLSPSATWRIEREGPAVGAIAAEALLGTLLTVMALAGERSDPAGPAPREAVLAAVWCVFAATLLPWTPYSYSMSSRALTLADDLALREAYRPIAADVGARLDGSPVVYLTTGEPGYLLDLATPCRYGSATFLQRASRVPHVATTRGLAENLACVDDERVRWAVVQDGWFTRPKVVSDRLDASFDCRAKAAFRERGLRFCPRRR